jgi:hypothetical protein
MRSLFLGAVLTVASLGLLGALPSSAEAHHWRTTSSYYPAYTYSTPVTYYTPVVSSYYYPPDYATYAPTYTTTSYYSPPVVTTSFYTPPTVTYYPRRVVYSPAYVSYRPVVIYP